ncbi:MAG: hypothetical protein P4L84_28595 [Isosphaeraceae bacterium]|nr:hypothetical protein [Isosphaeraceae bacterium]
MIRRFRMLVWLVPAVCSVLVIGLAAAYRIGRANGSATQPRAARAGTLSSQGGSTGGNAIRIEPVRPVLLKISPAQQAGLFFRIRPPAERKVPVSFFLHVLRLHGLDGRFDHPSLKTGRDVLRLLTDERFGRSYFGAPAVTRTRHGVEFIGAGASLEEHELASETHRDQCLASLAELGLPLSTPLLVGDEHLTLQAALSDSLANFHLKQEEFPWTAIAYTLYLPPQREWVNKFGERYTFDDLVDRLLTTPFEKASCGGTHLGYALTLLYRVDREHAPILSPAARGRLNERLARTVAAVLQNQAADGSWSLDWGRALYSSVDAPSQDAASAEGQLLATGHLAEWLLYLPREYAVPDDRLSRAGLWLQSRLGEFQGDSVSDGIVCPYTHAACVLRALGPKGGSPSAP